MRLISCFLSFSPNRADQANECHSLKVTLDKPGNRTHTDQLLQPALSTAQPWPAVIHLDTNNLLP